MDRYFLTEVGPGLFPGEVHHLKFRLENHSRIALDSQSAIKVHFSPVESESVIDQLFELEAGSSLVAIPEPIIAFTGSRLRSRTRLNLEQGASAIISEVIGRVAPTPDSLGPPAMDTAVEICYDARRIFVDRVAIGSNPHFGASKSWSAVTGESGCVGSLYFVGFEPGTLERIAGIMARLDTGSPAVRSTRPTNPTEELTIIRAKASDAASVGSHFVGIVERFLALQ